MIIKKKKLTEHVFIHPEMYIGSVELLDQNTWTWNNPSKKIIKKKITYPPGLYKIIDEILGKFLIIRNCL
jgi:DNA topoisomerase-2